MAERRAERAGGAQVDAAFQGSDREAVEMAAHLLRCDGLFLGSSAAMNCVGAVKARPLLTRRPGAYAGLWPRPLLAAAQPWRTVRQMRMQVRVAWYWGAHTVTYQA